MGALYVLTSTSLVILGSCYIYKLLSKSKRPLLPPGPKAKPLVGNLWDLPPKGSPEWLHWIRHKELYGPISSVTVMGHTIIILNDASLAVELLERRSTSHSSRPRMVFAGEMLGAENFLSSLTYSDRFRSYRKEMGRMIGTSVALSRFEDLQELEASRFVLRVLNEPEELMAHIRKEAGAIMLKLAYNYTVEPHGRDPLIDLADEVLDIFSRTVTPGAYLVDFIPALKYIPEWFPGAGFKRQAKIWRRSFMDLADRPYAFVKQQIREEINSSSYVCQLLQQENIDEDQEHVIKWSSASFYAGASDTTVSSIACFFLAMSLHPEIQQKAQSEIDRVVGLGRLPGLKDREKLPYVNAIVSEVLRWQPVAPMGLPHMTTQDDTCEGYLVPKGALILANIWAFLHDPNIYQEPMKFNPERFLELDEHPAEPDSHAFAFGFGRRICPGRLLADSSLYLTVVKTLATFKITKAVENGEEIEPVAEMLPGIISHPAPFKTNISPRSPKHAQLIRSFEMENPWQKSDAEVLENISTT